MKPWIKSKTLLLDVLKIPPSAIRVEKEIPAVPGNCRWQEREQVILQKLVPIPLLTRAMRARQQPVRVGDVIGPDHMDDRQIWDPCRGEGVSGRVQHLEAPVDGDFNDGRRGVHRRVDRAHAF